MFGDGTGYLDNGGFLEGVDADHAVGDLAGDGDDGVGVEQGVDKAKEELGPEERA